MFVSDSDGYDVAEKDSAEPDLPEEVVEEGTQIVEALLRAWANSGQDGEDVVMEDEDDTPEAQLAELRKCVEQFRPKVEGNTWAQSLLVSL